MEYVGPKKGWYVAPSIVDGGADGQIQTEREELTYAIHAPSAGRVKIGRTQNVGSRLHNLQVGSPVPLRLVATFDVSSGHSEESLHKRYAKHRSHGEWFSDEILDDLLSLKDEG